MNELSAKPSLKEINAYKKQLTWGDVPAIYQLASKAVGEIDGILSHGFDSAFKQLLDKNNWNTRLLAQQEKLPISLYHNYTEQHYELHCYPVMNGERLLGAEINNPQCPFVQWHPESMQMLFRINAIVPFIVYALQNGDAADQALVKFTHYKIDELIKTLARSFQITEVRGYSIAEFCLEVKQRHAL